MANSKACLVDVCVCAAVTSLTCRANCQPRLPVTVVCDNIRDPSNMAAIITAAAATSASQILLTKGLALRTVMLSTSGIFLL